jgi:putative ABC transport system ATP-binding protein
MLRIVRRNELRNTALLEELGEGGPRLAALREPRRPLFELRGVERRYSKGSIAVRAVRGVDLDIEAGELISLEGPSGSGKSTLLLMVGALEVPTAGTIRFAGRDLTSASDTVRAEIRSKEIGFVSQEFNLIPTLTALDNVEIAMIPRHVGHEDRRSRAALLLAQVGLAERLDHLPSRLSGGEQQRVAIARALANAPRVIIADEPTGNLDSESADAVMSVLAGLQADQGVTVIVATRDRGVAARAGHRVRLRDGRIVEPQAA